MNELEAARAEHAAAWKAYQRELSAIEREMKERQHAAFAAVRAANERIGAALKGQRKQVEILRDR